MRNAILGNDLKRRHYNKAPLVWLNMCSHWGKHSPQLYKLLRTYITIFDEYPVENIHSILRAQTKPSDSADELRNKAEQIFESKEQQTTFRSAFTSPSQVSFSQNQLQFLKVKCAQVLSSMLTRIATTDKAHSRQMQKKKKNYSSKISNDLCQQSHQEYCLTSWVSR